MDIRDRRALKSEAAGALSAASYSPKKIILIHAGAVTVLMLLISLIDILLEMQIAGTGGLRGLGTRTILTAVQTILENASTVILPFWNMGYIFAALAMARKESTSPSMLLQGFRKFGPVLRFFLLQNLIFLGLAILCFYPSMLLFLVTPLSDPLVAVLEPMLTSEAVADPTVLMDDPSILSAMAPMLIVFFCVYLLIAIPLFYRFRMANFALADAPKSGAFAAFRTSSRMMRGNRWALFRLDLSFWWFYALEVLCAAVCYGDVILAALGISLPMSANATYFLFYALGLGCQTALYYWAKNHVTVTYAKAYESLSRLIPSEPAPIPKNQPWSY